MKVYQSNEIRNLALIGGTKTGKTTLAETMLLEAKVISRKGSVEEKNTMSDYKPIELERQTSVYSTLLSFEYDNVKINLIDTPGIDDFCGEIAASLRVSECAGIVVNGQNGVDIGSEINWRNVQKYHPSCLVILNQLDHEKANFDETVNQAKQLYGSKFVVAQYPLNSGPDFDSIIDILSMKLYKYSKSGGVATITDIPSSEVSKAESYRNDLCEAAAENDEALMEVFFDQGTLNDEELIKGIKAGLIAKNIMPLFCVSAKNNIGISRLVSLINLLVPSPVEMPAFKNTEGVDVIYDVKASPSLFFFKTVNEQHVGEISYFKVMTGEITESIDLVNMNNGSKERLSQLFVSTGKNRVKIEKLLAGDIGASIKLKDCKTNHTLADKNGINIYPPISYPSPRYRIAIAAKNTADEEKLTEIINAIVKEDPSINVEHSKELKQTIVNGQGELHINVLKWLIEANSKIETEFISPRIPYRETITKSAKATYKHKKQSGGSGQFGEVYIMIEPYYEGMPDQTEFPVRGKEEKILPWGGKLIFQNCIVGGAIDARFLPAILKGIMDKMEVGPLTGCHARDIVISVYDGKMHPVDSNEISFKIAGMQAFREAFKNAGPRILEPIYSIEVVAPEDRTGDVMTDLQSRRAMIEGIEGEGRYQRIKAKIPLAELDRYSTTLSSLTNGRATYSLTFSDYQQVSSDVQTKIIKEYEELQKDEDK